ncbi:M14 family zinc carboxypeptidase [Kribbella sancticallisti]|uniref:M14 family zinc carboxypeptidase n=1 Tax=Kribbella sancticallisti TaxID=460087 RepID=A0ABP4PL66_9ACTN
MIDSWLKAEIEAVPSYSAFAGVDEIVDAMRAIRAEYPDLAQLRRIGTSRLGEPIESLTIAGGGRHAVVFAFPHPNEPIGGLSALHLARRLCADAVLRASFDLTWHIVGCIDPDGTRLNEGWFAGPFTRTHYARHFYRPAGREQIEWTFPFQYKRAYFDDVLPETLGLMRLIDRTRPAFMCSLHNTELGGVYYYLSQPVTELYPTLQAIPAHLGLPLHHGEPESPSMVSLADGIFPEMRTDRMYDYRESIGEDPSGLRCGATSSEYASQYGTLTLIGELPYWSDPTADDTTPTDTSYATAIRQQGEGLREFLALTTDVLEAVGPQLSTNSPFVRASRYFIPALSRMPDSNSRRADEASAQRPATMAEVTSCADVVHSFRLRYGGMLLRALDGELAVGNGTPTIRSERERLADSYERWCALAEQATPAEPLPIRSLVATQYAAMLATARQAAGR